jgi:hypothetical protein
MKIIISNRTNRRLRKKLFIPVKYIKETRDMSAIDSLAPGKTIESKVNKIIIMENKTIFLLFIIFEKFVQPRIHQRPFF